MGATLESVYTTSLLISSSNELFQNFTVHEIQAYVEAAGLALVIFPALLSSPSSKVPSLH